MKKFVFTTLLMLFSLGWILSSNAQYTFPPFYKFEACQVTNDQGAIIQYGNTCDFGNKPCIPNPCNEGFGE